MDDVSWQKALRPKARWMLLVDLESTCSDYPGGQMIGKGQGEAIEIGVVVIDLERKIWPQGFHTLARPIGNPILTGRCTGLTGITQQAVDAAPSFPLACAALSQFLSSFQEWAWASWGQSDLDVLAATAARHGIGSPLPAESHHNLKTTFAALRADETTLGQAPAMNRLTIQPHGKHHRALSDACNLTRLYRAMRRYDRAQSTAAEAFGDLNRARQWMRENNPALHGRRPATMLHNDTELAEVLAVIDRQKAVGQR